VVDSERRENSVEALEEAIVQGYWMVEIDVRPTGDDVPVVYHESHLPVSGEIPVEIAMNECGVLKEVSEGSLLTFDEYLDRTSGRIGLMVNYKNNNSSETYLRSIEELLSRREILSEIYVIGVPRAKEFFLGKSRVSINPRFLDGIEDYRAAAAAGRYLFGHGCDMHDSAVSVAFETGLEVVPSVNIYHYLERGDDYMEAGAADLDRLHSVGVRTFQIDSIYESVFSKQ